MPGHKGRGLLGFEAYDLTEITGADSLYEATGIIAESEKNASKLFDSRASFYSTEGSSQCIRAMIALACGGCSEKPLIVAARNAHKAFVYAAALVDADVLWIRESNEKFTLCRSVITPNDLEKTLKRAKKQPSAVYLTSPDYLGGILDIEALAGVAHRYGVPLLVDNAHGAYLRFLDKSAHPIDLGADICCDSAHKTLPVLTGGAYLHISKNAISDYENRVRSAMAMFGSTSPSYLILQSLDAANKYLAEGYREKLSACMEKLCDYKEKLQLFGYKFEDSDPLKLTMNASEYGYSGYEIAGLLERENISVEYYDPDFVVMMFTPENADTDYENLLSVLTNIPRKEALKTPMLSIGLPEAVLSPRKAIFSSKEQIAIEESEGRILAEPNVSCPPAVTPISCGERITKEVIEIFKYYGTERVSVVIQ